MHTLEAARGRWPAVRRAVVALVVLAATGARAQIPDTFTNLQVLGKDTPKDKLVETMRGFTSALGVRCTHCHVGEEGQPLSSYDFASDAKPAKKTARLMMQMAGEINDQWIGKVESERADRVRVSCATCHHGQPVPRSIQATVQAVLADQGLEAAVQKYRELRRDSYGRDTFDFGEPPLNQVARQLMAEKKTTEAIALLELNAEFHPQSAQVAALLGEAHLAAGDRDQGLASFRRALELDPKNDRLRKRIEELEKPAGR